MPIKGALENSTLRKHEKNLNIKMNVNSNMYSQIGVWEQGQKLTPLVSQVSLEKTQELHPVGGDCHHIIYLNPKIDFFFMTIVGAMAIAPYGSLLNQKFYIDIMIKSFKKYKIKRETT